MRGVRGITFDGAVQFELDLFPRVPWDGRSPRGLTRGWNVLPLRQEPLGHEVEADPAQLAMCPVASRPLGKKMRRSERGASLLLRCRRGTRRGLRKILTMDDVYDA